MKKIILLILIMIMFISVESKALSIVVNNIPINSAELFIENGRTMAPIRFVSESLGAEVTYISESGLIIVKDSNTRIVVKISEKWAIVNKLGKSDTRRELDATVVIKDDRAYVPLRFVAECLEAQVIWDHETDTVFIAKS